MKLIDAIMNGDSAAAREEFTAAINDKVNTVLDIRRVTMASDVFNQVQEAASIKKEILNPNVVKDLPEDLHADDMMYNDCEDDEDLDEAVKLRSKVIITKGPKDVQGKTGFVGEINRGLHKGDESYVIDVQGGGHITLRRGSFKLAAKDKVNEEDLDEAKTPGQKFDMDKVNAGAISRDEYNKKYKLGKYRPAGNKLAGPGGLYKNLVKKP